MAKTLLVFDIQDKPENMGQIQTIDGTPDSDVMKKFISERTDHIPNAVISGNIMTFTKGVDSNGSPIIGKATLSVIPDDFKTA